MSPIFRARLAPLAAVLAAICMCVGWLLALLLVPGYQPSQHPLPLLGSLPGALGMLFRWLLFILPGLLMGIGLLCWGPSLQGSRLARISQQLAVIAALGFMLMGALGLSADGELEQAVRGQAVAWLLWLSAAVAGMGLLAVSRLPAAGVAAASLLAALAVLLPSVLPLPLLPGPLALLLAALVWMGWGMVIGQVGAKMAGLPAGDAG